MIKYIYSFLSILITLLLVSSCNRGKIYYSYDNNKSMCNRILIFSEDSVKGYSDKPHRNYSLFACYPFNNKEIYEISGTVKQFDSLLKTGKRTGYCCCPQTNYKISFYNNTDEFDNYYVDTLELKDTVRIYQTSFQFSYLIEKEKWIKFLRNTKKITYKEYKTNNLTLAREIFKISQKSNLPILTSHNVSDYWMYFNGSFNAQISSNEEELDDEKIIEELNDKYSNINYKINVGSIDIERNDRNLIKSTVETTVYCNKDFYDKFSIFKTKKYLFKETKAQFYVIGSQKQLENFDKELFKNKIFL